MRTSNAAQRRGLARAIAADQADNLAGTDFERDAMQDLDRSVGSVE